MINLTDLLKKMFEVRDQIHYWHLQTKSYAEHKALNQFYDDWLDLVDQFTETSQGRYPYVSGQVNITLEPFNGEVSQDYLRSVLSWLQTEARKGFLSSDTDLNNILDEMQALTSQTIYMLNMR